MAKISRWFPNCLVYVYKVSLRLFPGFSSNNMVARRAYIILQFLTFSSLRLVLGFIPLLQRRFQGFSLILKSFLVSVSKWTERLAL